MLLTERRIKNKELISQMIGALSRRLRVRDDGTGDSRENYCTYAEFMAEDAIIFLGDPGMGKTTFFKEVANASYTTVRKFLVNPHAAEGETLFLDALDEYRTVSNGSDASFEVAKELCNLKKPKFRLSCRSSDWFGSTDQEVLKVASASGRVVVIELCSLSRDEILSAVQGVVPDPILFFEEAESAGLEKLLGNPQTLELLARAWGTDKKPRNKFEAYEIGVSELLKEINPEHIVRGMTSPDPGNLRKAASAAVSTLLLSNSVGISRTETADGDGYIRLPVVPYSIRNDIDTALRRRLFISTDVDRFEPIHRTIAEFLAAEDLANRIMNGLSIGRVMALICGIDGKPISSLRGLYAWLMCKIGSLAEGYVERDPYGVVTYGDASVLSPNAQCAIWVGLRKLRDPWFLANQEDRGSFRDLANQNTAKIIHQLLKDTATGTHLKIAILESIGNSTTNVGLDGILREMVLAKHHTIWLRSTALKAFVKSVKNDWVQLDALDRELNQIVNDSAAPKIRADLLCLTRTDGSMHLRVLSIMEQVASGKRERHHFGHFYNLIDLPSVEDLSVILDNVSRVLLSKNETYFELRSIFDEWLKRCLESASSITPLQLASWLQNMRVGRDRKCEKTLAALKKRFEQEPLLFEKVFYLLVHMVPNNDRSFGFFVTYDLWHLLPAIVWPVSHCEFFLKCAEMETDSERAGELFHMYLSWFPKEGASVALTEAGFDFLDRRHDVAKGLGNWNCCKIEKWRTDESKRSQKERRKKSVTRTKNVAYFNSRLTTIREGVEEHALAWAAMVYLGYDNIDDISDARERLVSLTNDEIADAIIEGFILYAESPTIPEMEAVIESWHANNIPYTHALLCLSVYLRINVGMTVPMKALPHCISVVVTEKSTCNKLPGYDETLTGWILQEASQNPDVVRSVLHEMWVSSSTHKKGILPGFYELSQDSGSQQFLASLSVEVLRSGINEDSETLGKLVSVLLHQRPAGHTCNRCGRTCSKRIISGGAGHLEHCTFRD